MQLKLVYLEDFDFVPKDKPDKKHRIYVFLEAQSLQILYGADIKGTFEKYKFYNCEIEYKGGKLKVVSAQ